MTNASYILTIYYSIFQGRLFIFNEKNNPLTPFVKGEFKTVDSRRFL